MTNVSISLPDKIKAYIDERLNEGQFSDTSEYFLELVREDQKRRADTRLEQLLVDGLDSGEPIEMTDEYVQSWRSTLKKTIASSAKRGD